MRRLFPCLTCFAAVALSPRATRAETAGAVPSLAGFEVLATAGYGAATMNIGKLDIEPYGASFGLQAGYVWRQGFRLGAYASFGLGRAVEQTYDPFVGRPVELTADTSMTNVGLSVAYDVPLYMLVLRYELKLGASIMSWSFGKGQPNLIEYYSLESPTEGIHAAPGVSLILPLDRFECGAGFYYFGQVNDAIPSGFVGLAFAGVKL